MIPFRDHIVLHHRRDSEIVKKVDHSIFLFAVMNDALFPVVASSGFILFNSLSKEKVLMYMCVCTGILKCYSSC